MANQGVMNIPIKSEVPNPAYGTPTLVHQQPFIQFSSAPIAQVPASVNSFRNVMVNQFPIKQEVVGTDNNGNNILTTSAYSNTASNFNNNVFVNNNNTNINNIRPMPMKVIGLKPGDNVLPARNIQGLPPGAQNNCILVKTVNGYQLVNLASLPPSVISQITSTVPPTNVTTTPPAVKTVPVSAMKTVPVSTVKTVPVSRSSVVPANSPAPGQLSHEAMIKKASLKLSDFFKHLLIESAKNGPATRKQLINLIQSLVDKKLEPEQFCEMIEKILNAQRQPKLLTFIQNSIMHLRKSLILGEVTIDGVRAPAISALVQTQPTVNQKVLTNTSHGKSVPVSVAVPPAPVRTPTPKVSVPMPPRTVNAPSITKTMPSVNRVVSSPATKMISSKVLTGAQTSNGKSLLNHGKLKPIPVFGKVVQRTQQLPVVSASSATKLPSVLSNIKTERSSPVSFGANRQQLPVSQASGQSILTQVNKSVPVPNAKKLPTSLTNPNVNSILKIRNTPLVDEAKPNIAKQKEKQTIETPVEDITDVLALGGVDVDKESEFLSLADKIGAIERSCPEPLFLNLEHLQARIFKALQKYELKGFNKDVPALVSQAVEQLLKDLVGKMSIIVEHRMNIIKNESRYEQTGDIRAQLKFLEGVDKAKRMRREAEEREKILIAGKSRSKNDEIVELREKAKEIKRNEMDQQMTRDTNDALMHALGPIRKKAKLDNKAGVSTSKFLKNRTKKVSLKDLVFVLQNEKPFCRSQFLHNAYLKSKK